MSEHNTLSDDFTQGSIVGKLVKFMVQVLGALILQAMYGAVDLLVVGQFGTDAGISAEDDREQVHLPVHRLGGII